MKRKFIVVISTCFMISLCLIFGTKCKAADKSVFISDANAYGFYISSDFTPYKTDGFETFQYIYEEKNTVNYETDIVHVLLRNDNDPSLWCYLYRVTTSPLQVRYWGFIGFGSHSDDWSTKKVRTTINFNDGYNIINYAPQNSPRKETRSIGVGFGVDGPSISASVNYDHNELTVTSNTKTASNKYETVYDFNGYNSFTKGDYYSYGMVMFKHIGEASIDVEYEVGYYGNGWYKYHTYAPSTHFYNFTL